MADREVPEGYMRNSVGLLAPIDKVKPQHKLEDELVRKLVGRAEVIHGMLLHFCGLALDEVDSFRELVAAEYGVSRGGSRGNITLTSYDGTLQVQITVNQNVSFGPELEAAKQLIDSCILRWSETSGSEVKALVQYAFQTNKKGKIDTARVLGLRQLEIDDPEWKRAMDAIADAVRHTASKTYPRIYRRDPIKGDLTPITLDMPSVGRAMS